MKSAEKKLYGVLARFESTDRLISAAERVRQAGYRNTDAFTSFPVHGVHEALGARKSRLALAVLIAGAAGAGGGLLLQAWVSMSVYPHIASGKPFFSWPSFVPIIFECTVLAAALTAFLAMLIRNGLPRPHHPVFDGTYFEDATTDAFFICVEASDPNFNQEQVTRLLREAGAQHVETVYSDEV